MTLENLPNIYLIIMAIGMFIVLIGILRLAHLGDDVEAKQTSNEPELADVFHYFLQEEEKKNNDMRAMLLRPAESTHTIDKTPSLETQKTTVHKEIKKETNVNVQNRDFIRIIERYQNGESVDNIAKALGKGVGEVKLILSLYAAENQ